MARDKAQFQRRLSDVTQTKQWAGEASVAQDEVAAEIEGPLAVPVTPSSGDTRQHRKPARWPLPEHLPRERMHPAPSACPCYGGRLRKLGEDITETLEQRSGK